jgi:sterol desaturase/sphingolipid hydroxylase (fatty acid hydroxylase superfamily)
MHMIHHRTHRHNYFFVTGFVWDALFQTAATKPEAVVSDREGTPFC